MKSVVYLPLITLITHRFFLSTAKSCPITDQPSQSSFPKFTRGHHKPFGYHARRWKRLQTVYEHPDPQTFYNDYVRLSKPLVIKGGAADWPAIKKWTNISYINAIGGKERNTVNWKKIYDYDRHHAIRIDMTMKEFTDKFNDHDLYMDATIPVGLHDDVHWPHSLGCQFFLKRVKQLAIMMNNGRSKSDVHIDATDTYFMQATGKRLWLLSPPSNVTKIYSGHPHLVDHAGISILNQTHMDLEKYQQASKLDIYAALINPGDIIYVPEGWYHQVVTNRSPNIAIVAFLHILFCEYHHKQNDDVDHVRACVNNVRSRKPKTLKCNSFPRENTTIKRLLKMNKIRNKEAFNGLDEDEDEDEDRIFRYSKPLTDGTLLTTLGVALTGMKKEALQKGAVLKQAIVEGYRLFCTAPSDGSEEALGKALKRQSKLRNNIHILSYISIQDPQRSSIADSIQASLNNLNTSYIDFVLLSAPYCVPDYKVGACTRDHYNQAWTDAWKELEHIHKQGKIRFLGVSDFSLTELKHLMAVASVPVTIVRARFDLYFRQKQLRRFCKDNNIHFMGRSVLGGRWKEEQPDWPENRDIFKQYEVKQAAYLFKVSIHAAVYDWAIKKNVIVCPRVNDPLHVRVNVKAIDSDSNADIANVQVMDKIDPLDNEGIYVKTARASEFSKEALKVENEDSGITISDSNAQSQRDKERVMNVFSGNYSEEEYTDEKDYEVFPTYMLGEDADS